jgi:hypothetical protein
MEQGPEDAGRRRGGEPGWKQRGEPRQGRSERREGKGRGDAARLWTREKLRRVTAPEGRAREREWSGRPHRLREAGPRPCEPRMAGGATRGLRPRPSSVRRLVLRDAGRRIRLDHGPRPGHRHQRKLGTAPRGDGGTGDAGSERPGRPGSGAPRQPARCPPGQGFGPARVYAPATAARGRGAPPPVTPEMEGSPVPRLVGSGASAPTPARRSQAPHRSSDRERAARGAVPKGRPHRKEWSHPGAGWKQDRAAACNQANPMVGCRVQQTCTACVEQAVEAVRNGTGGTSPGVASRGRRLARKPRRSRRRKPDRAHVQSAGHPAWQGR